MPEHAGCGRKQTRDRSCKMNANHDEYFLGVTLFMLIERMKNNCFYYFFNIKQVFAFKVEKVINLIIVIEFNPQY